MAHQVSRGACIERASVNALHLLGSTLALGLVASLQVYILVWTLRLASSGAQIPSYTKPNAHFILQPNA